MAVRHRAAEEGYLSDDLVRQLVAVGQLDVLAATVTLNDAPTVGAVVRAAETALLRQFRRERGAVLVVDRGSRDGTLARIGSDAASADAPPPLRTFHRIVAACRGWSEASTLRTILIAADLVGARCLVLLGAGTASIDEGWVERLVRPCLKEGYDLVLPRYRRQRFDGLLVQNLSRPVLRGLFGLGVHEPFGSELSLSSRLVGRLLAERGVETEAMGGGVGMWAAAACAAESYRVCEAGLGARRLRERAGRAELGRALHEVVGTTFACLERYESFWRSEPPGGAVPYFGPELSSDDGAAPPHRRRLLARFREGLAGLGDLLGRILAPETRSRLEGLAAMPPGSFRFDDELWTRTVYDFAASYHRGVVHREHVVQALGPIYLGRAASFLAEHRDDDATAIDASIERLAEVFTAERPYLVKRWTGGE